MRVIKYVLFTIIISIISINVVFAANISCTYKNTGVGSGNWTWICDVSLENGVKCHTTDTKNTYVYGSNNKIEDVIDLKPSNFLDNESGVLSCSAVPNIKIDTYGSSDGKTHVDKITAYGSCPASQSCMNFSLINKESPSSGGNSAYNVIDYAGYCLYGDTSLYYVCGIKNDGDFACKYGGNGYKLIHTQAKQTLTKEDFLSDDGNIKCASSVNVCFTDTEGYDIVDETRIKACPGEFENLKLAESKKGDFVTYDYEKDEDYIKAKANKDLYCSELDYSKEKCEQAMNEMERIKNAYLNNEQIKEQGNDHNQSNNFDTALFCYRDGVKNTFRSIGWVIFALKIVTPFLIIVFGIIDFAKAIIASKEDEIKKSARSLGFRIASGIIIFFIPSLVSFIVKTTGGDKLYDKSNDTFGFCPLCMTEPNNEACKK